MANPQESYPETATNGARKKATNGDGNAALQDALTAHGDDLADLIEGTDEVNDALTTAILIAASADEADLEHITSSTTNLIAAVDGLSTEEAAALASDLGSNADDLSASLDTILEVQREGHLDDFVTIATAFSESLAAEEVEELSTLLAENGTEIVDTLEVLLDLQREGHLDEVVELAKTLSVLEIDEDAAAGLNTLLGAVGEAQRRSAPGSGFGLLKQLSSRDVRAGLGYVVALLKAQGRRLRKQ